MINKITRLLPVVTARRCPGCGHVVLQVLIAAARADFDCPRCQRYKFSDFVPVTDPDPRPGGDVA